MIKTRKWKWQYAALAFIMLAAFWLNFYNQSKEGTSNAYYTAAVTSMLENPKAFFYASLDSGLYVTVDKPPLGLWIQAISCAVFGVNSFGILFPQALAGVLCSLIIFFLVRRYFGDTAGVVAAAVMAFTPILIALDRTNNLDTLLLFFLLCSAAFALRAARKRSFGQWLLAVAFVGLGFNIKMLEAYMVLPAVFLVYWLAVLLHKKGKRDIIKLVLQSVAAILVLVVTSFSWAVAVDLTDPETRPYIGSSEYNSVLDLALGYNGLTRLVGRNGGGSSGGGGAPERRTPNTEESAGYNSGESIGENGVDRSAPGAQDGSFDGENGLQPPDMAGEANQEQQGALPTDENRPQRPDDTENGMSNRAEPPGGMNRGGGGGAGGGSESGETGVFRLYSTQLSGLVSWFLLPALLIAGAACVSFCLLLARRKKTVQDAAAQMCYDRTIELVFWAAWLLPMAVVFSFGGFIHRYYVVLLAPALAALTGAGVGLLLQKETLLPKRQPPAWLFPTLFAATLAVQIFIAARTDWKFVGIPMAVCGVLGLLAWRFRHIGRKLGVISVLLMGAAVFMAPIAWSFTPVLYYNSNATIPNAGPELAQSQRPGGNGVQNGEAEQNQTTLAGFIAQNYNDERWALAVSSAQDASEIIIETKLPVMAITGWAGDDILTLDKLKEYVANGDLRYFMVGGGMGGGRSADDEVTDWVQEAGTVVDASEYAGTSGTLYDLSGAL